MEILVEDLQKGDHKAFEKLFDKYYEALCRYAYSLLKDSDEAEDLVQRTFCKLWDNRESINIQTSISSYLYRMVHNDFINYTQLKRNRTTLGIDSIEFSHFEGSESGDQAINHQELMATYENALNKLTDQCRKVFELSRVRNLKNHEISSELNISVKTVEAHITKALKHLKIELKDFFILIVYFQLLM